MKSDRLKLFLPLIVFGVVALMFFVLENRIKDGEYDPKALPSALVGKPIPAFELPLLADANVIKDQSALRGRAALLNVWATWCPSCRVEHAYLNILAQREITIYGLNYKDSREEALLWLERLGNPYQFNLFDEQGSLGLNLGVYGAPETYVIDENGIVRYRHVGVLDEKVWQRRIVPLGLKW